ncbi:MAG: sigma 54-interacting transcriptional regulator [Phycisphaerales bacterium]|nr:sigma 54-interacting transcriptional regulator [Phycisphaerales bacterium]
MNPIPEARDGTGSTPAALRATFPLQLDRNLIAAATTIGDELDLPALVTNLHSMVSGLPGLQVVGIAAYDEKRRMLSTYTLESPGDSAGPPSPQAVIRRESTRDEGDSPSFDAMPRTYVSGDLSGERTAVFQEELYRSGVRRYASVAAVLRGRVIGQLFLGFHDCDAIPPETVSFLERIAVVVAPVLWNCIAHDWFARGNRRRDMLIALNAAINGSLEVDTVISSSFQAIGQIEHLRLCIIGLVGEDEHAPRCYEWRYADVDGTSQAAVAGMVSCAVGLGAWMAWHREPLESEDLQKAVRQTLDVEWRALGVRRYVVTPMLARGRRVGAVLFGSSHPYAANPVDRWMYDFIATQLALATDNAMQHERIRQLLDRAQQQNVYLREEIQGEHSFGEIIGNSPAMRRVCDAIRRVAETTATVLITGATGVGKELVARAIHGRSDRADQPMVKLNCAAIPEGMVESELFGHERGAFTSAIERRIGRFELARDGTLFLDEVGELALGIQTKLLRVLQDGEFERVGGSETIRSNARILAATNRDLARAVRDGAFRADLYYRLNVFPIHISSLEERREDIPALIEAFILQLSRRMGKRIEGVASASLNHLCGRDWPGNVRELQHVIERAMILCDGSVLNVEIEPSAMSVARADADGTLASPASSLQVVEADHIRGVLERTRGVIEGPRGAARLLGLKPSTLRFRMRRHGIERPV